MTVDVRLVTFGALLLLASSGLFFEAGVSNYLAVGIAAVGIAAVAVVGTMVVVARARAGEGDARAV